MSQCKDVTKNAGSAACCKESQTCETGAGTKKKEVYSGAVPGRMVDPHLKDQLPFLLQPVSLVGIGKGGLFSIQISC